MRGPAAVQRGGSADLDPLWDELANWPGYYVEDITPSAAYGSHDRDGKRPTGTVGGYHQRFTDQWCVTVEADGWEPRDRWLMWGSSIADAAAKLGDYMRDRRLNPHLMHIEAGEFRTGCPSCVTDAAMDAFAGVVEWTPA